MTETHSFFSGFYKHYREKKLIRWITFTYPKTVALAVSSGTFLILYQLIEETKQNERRIISFNEASHANDNITRRNKNMVIYDGDPKS